MMKNILQDFSGKVVALSATPYGKDGLPLAGFDLHINKYNTLYMIENGYLVAPTCYRSTVPDLSSIGVVAGDYKQNDLDDKFNTITEVMSVVNAVKEKIEKRKHCITFCITISHCKLMAKAYSSEGIPTEPYHSNMTGEQRGEVLKRFKAGEINITNPASLAEGFDFPALDTVVIARPTKSANRARQMVGRALRINPGKTNAVILDCAGMIENTGFPTDPIRPIEKVVAKESKPFCVACKSKRVYRTIKEKVVYKKCAECGSSEEIPPREYYFCEKEDCGKVWGSNVAILDVVDSTLMLLCDCGHKTSIIHETTKADMKEMFDKTLIETLSRKFIAEYCTHIISIYGVDHLYRDDIIANTKRLANIAKENPRDIVGKNYLDWEKEFPEKKEMKIIYPGEKEMKIKKAAVLKKGKNTLEKFNSAKTFEEILEYAVELFSSRKHKLDDKRISEIRQQIKLSPLKDISSLVSSRIKNIYRDKIDLSRLDGFIQWIESKRISE
jgi:hypothetical protein